MKITPKWHKGRIGFFIEAEGASDEVILAEVVRRKARFSILEASYVGGDSDDGIHSIMLDPSLKTASLSRLHSSLKKRGRKA